MERCGRELPARGRHNETGGAGRRGPHMHYDAIHKLLCSFPRVIADILRGYLGGKLLHAITTATTSGQKKRYFRQFSC